MVDISKLWLFRIIPFENLGYDLKHGLFSRKMAPNNVPRVNIGSPEVINSRDKRVVKCYPGTHVNDYVPFYFSTRTPMLYNIVTGYGVPKRNQEEIIYLCCRLLDLANPNFSWCFTDGNAASAITQFYDNLEDMDKLDWHSITTTDFRNDNSDGDSDRGRKKHAEFLVRGSVPADRISAIVVLNQNVGTRVQQIVASSGLPIQVHVDTKLYF